MNKKTINAFIALSIFFQFYVLSFPALSDDSDVISVVKNYAYKDGEPYALSQVYAVEPPDEGFLPYYIYHSTIEGVFPFVINREGVKGKDEPYTRCNIAFKINGKVLIPERRYNSGYAEDSEPCLGFLGSIKKIQGKGNIDWLVTNSVYQIESDNPDKINEVYFNTGNKICYAGDISVRLSSGKIKLSSLGRVLPASNDFSECSKNN
ncbi:hypothetical protein [Enterobacter cloacae complex sp. ESBL7]|uniref:hypothetical protein n=1 Tax=Enterobacter cloacae complex sp. ESBL7 TaxID=3163325 RepID=UPI003564BE99